MRLLVVAIVNLLRALLLALSLPGRLSARRRRPLFIRFRLEGDPTYRKGRRRGLGLLRRRREPDTVGSIQELGEALDTLADDPRVHGAVFELDGLTVSPAKRVAIAQLIEDFRSRRKRAIGYAVNTS